MGDMAVPRTAWPVLRWVIRLALCIGVVSVNSVATPAETAASTAILEALDQAVTEEEATKIVEPHLGGLKKLDSKVVEAVVLRQWWGLSRILVAKSHEQTVDLSFAVRKAVRTLKDEADELLRTLNPKYGQAQQVAPAFQWAQNDTSVFLTVKFTVRWNAPGALEVTEPFVSFLNNTFNFSGLGKHSNNKYKYQLALGLFDNINVAESSWSTASVGKLAVTFRKKWARKWPRLLANKKTKIGNMHVWMEMQDKLDTTLGGMATVSNSPVTCSALEKLYCLATDTCKKPGNCAQCPGKTVEIEAEHMCTGMPTEKASLDFKDVDMDRYEIGGTISITKARNDFDIDNYVVYWGKDDKNKLEVEEGKPLLVGEAVANRGNDVRVVIKPNSKLPDQATHLLVFSKNEYGEYPTPGNLIVKEAYLPSDKPKSLTFADEDGDKGQVSGTVTVGRAADEKSMDEYTLHWGKSANRKIAASSHIRDIPKETTAEGASTYYISRDTKIPEGASHLLVFCKNEHGEHSSPASLKVVDNMKPCIFKDDFDCPVGVAVHEKEDVTGFSIKRAKDELEGKPGAISHYVLHFGRESCDDGGGAKNGHLIDLAVAGLAAGDVTYDRPKDREVPEGTSHILVYAKNAYGESEFCVSAEYPAQPAKKTEL